MMQTQTRDDGYSAAASTAHHAHPGSSPSAHVCVCVGGGGGGGAPGGARGAGGGGRGRARPPPAGEPEVGTSESHPTLRRTAQGGQGWSIYLDRMCLVFRHRAHTHQTQHQTHQAHQTHAQPTRHLVASGRKRVEREVIPSARTLPLSPFHFPAHIAHPTDRPPGLGWWMSGLCVALGWCDVRAEKAEGVRSSAAQPCVGDDGERPPGWGLRSEDCTDATRLERPPSSGTEIALSRAPGGRYPVVVADVCRV